MNDFLTVSETAAYLRLSKAQVYILISQKRLPHVRLGQKRVVVRREHLEEWLKAQTVLAR